jgi:hypothetical protein
MRHRAVNEYELAWIIRMIDNGYTDNRIAKLTGRSKVTIKRIREKYATKNQTS